MKPRKAIIGKLAARRGRTRSTLFRDYFTIISMIILICFIILGGSLVLFVANYWRDEKSEMLAENARSVAKTTADIVSSNESSDNGVLMICNNLKSVSDSIDADVFVCNLDGKVIYCQDLYQRGYIVFGEKCFVHVDYQLPKSVTDAIQSGEFNTTGTLNGMFDESNFVCAVPITVNDIVIGIVVAAQPSFDIIAPYVKAIVKTFGLSALVIMIIAFITVYLMTYEMTKPLRQMSMATKRYSQGDFSYRVSEQGNNELSELGSAFNSMATSLANLENSRRSFVANVSHELKTPMTTIGGFIDGILDGTIEKDRQEQYLAIVSDEVKRLSRLVTGMLNMSKIEAGELKLNKTEFDISDMLFKTLLSFEQLLQKKDVDVLGLDRLESVTVSADADMINQVIYNLVENAQKFTPNGGYIEVSVSDADGFVTVSIKNSGEGISSEEIAKIFERFYKVDRSRSYDVKGAGLGLYIVKSLVQLHGGAIEATSTEHEYTQFTFRLPK